ncbi:MAG: hypothetical protein WAT39_02730, partial [Planctomycetota bacterium]
DAAARERAAPEPLVGQRIAAPPTADVPASLREFVALVRDPGDRQWGTFLAADFTRLCRAAGRADTEPGLSQVTADLDGDGRDEVVVMIGDGWWGNRVDACLFTPCEDGWRVADRWQHDGAARGTPALRVVAAEQRRWVVAGWTDGWGTGYARSSARWFEASGGRLVQVLHLVHSGEEVYGGTGPVLEWGVGDLQLRADEGGSWVATATATIGFWAGEFGDAIASIDVDRPMRWQQRAPGAPFVAIEPVDGGDDVAALWRIGARAWVTRHGEAARAFVGGTEAQCTCLRRTCGLALGPGPCPAASALLALLPPPPAGR